MPDSTPASIKLLNSFLRGEISAVETYQDVLQKVTASRTRTTLQECAQSHEHRVQQLRSEITRMGGTPADGAGAWGTFTGLFEGGARAFGGRVAIAALARREDRGMLDYRDNFWRLDQPSKEFVEGTLLPAQEQTKRAIHELQRNLS